jgi:hypothetical protein
MRLPGSWYLDAQGQPLARASIEAASGRCYGADELAAALLACRGLGEQGEIAIPALHGRGVSRVNPLGRRIASLRELPA